MSEQFSIDYNTDDIAELITVIRVQKEKKSQDAFSKMLEIKPETLDLIEEGKSAHIHKTLQKCIDLGLIVEAELHFKFRT
jgi:DNA-binding XRE family transcriptional regulator